MAEMADTTKGLGFARALLAKYGWQEGKGLGRNEDGIVQPLKPKLKFDNAGIGHNGDVGEFTSRWWEQAYNKVAKTINVKQSKGDVQVKLKGREELFKSKDTRPVSMYTPTDYDAFVKTSLLTAEGVMESVEPELSTDPFPEEEDISVGASTRLSDTEIFRACGGRTVHKGARHGLKLNGKLARLQRQEEELLNPQLHQPNSVSDCEEAVDGQKSKKHTITSGLEGTTNGIVLESVLPCEERKEKEKDHSSNELDDNCKLSKKERKRKKIYETESTETVSPASGTLYAICFSLPFKSDVCFEDNSTERKKKKKKIVEENEEIVDCEMTEPVILEPQKKRKQKKREETKEALESDMTDLLVLEPQKKKKKMRDENEAFIDSEKTNPLKLESQKKRKKKKETENEGTVDSEMTDPDVFLEPQKKRKKKEEKVEKERAVNSETTGPLLLQSQKKRMKKKLGNHKTGSYVTE